MTTTMNSEDDTEKLIKAAESCQMKDVIELSSKLSDNVEALSEALSLGRLSGSDKIVSGKLFSRC